MLMLSKKFFVTEVTITGMISYELLIHAAFSVLHQPTRSCINVPVLHILINFSCATRPFLSKDCQTNAIWPFSKLFLSPFCFSYPIPWVQACGGKEGSVKELVWYLWFIINSWHRNPCKSQDPACARQHIDAVLGNVLNRKTLSFF